MTYSKREKEPVEQSAWIKRLALNFIDRYRKDLEALADR